MKRSEWTFNQQNGTSGGRRVAVILHHDVSFGVVCGSGWHKDHGRVAELAFQSSEVQNPAPSGTSDLGDFLYCHVRKGVVGHTKRKAKKHR